MNVNEHYLKELVLQNQTHQIGFLSFTRLGEASVSEHVLAASIKS